LWQVLWEIRRSNTQQQEQTTMSPSSFGNVPPLASPFPALPADGSPVNPRQHVEPNTGLALALGWVVLILFLLVALATLYLFVILLVGAIVNYVRQRRALAQVRGSCVAVSADQFPEIYHCALTLSQRMGLAAPPEIFIAEGNVINAAAMRVAGKHVVVLMDDVVDACLRSQDPRTLTFILAHELAHHALGHTGYFRAQISRMFRWLSRLDEYTCDRVAGALVENQTASFKALSVLLIGPQLLPHLNVARLQQQARDVASDRTAKKAEKNLTHPLLLKRLSRFTN
jgi:Zn-dependent protease with chaperone function